MKVSVSVVTYQQSETVRQALDSVFNQKTDFDFEVIIGDDASTDGTQSRLKEFYAFAPDRVRLLLREENAQDRGLTNLLATVDAAKGEYIAFLDGDDYWTDPEKLQKQIDFLDTHPECVSCAHRVQHLHTNGVKALSPNAPKGREVHDVGALIKRNFAPKISTIIRTSALEDLPDWYRSTTVASADWLLNVLVGRHGNVGFINEVMAVHRIHSASVSAMNGTEKMISDKLHAIPTLQQYLPQKAHELHRLERQLKWKRRTVHWAPGAFKALKRINELLRSRPR